MSEPISREGLVPALDVCGGSRDFAIGAVDARMVRGDMYNTTYSYTNNVQNSPSSRSHWDRDANSQRLDIDLGGRRHLELPTSIFHRLLQTFRIHPRDSDGQRDFTLSTVEDAAEAPADKRTLGEVYVYSMLHAGKGFPCWKPEPRKPLTSGEGVVPGDVGVLSVEGGFVKIFNVWDDETSLQESEAGRSAKAPYNAPPRPVPFIRTNELAKGKALVAGAWYETIYESDDKTISHFEFHHLPSHQQGAVLAMTSTGKLEELDGSDKMALREVISQHAGLIYKYANDLRTIGEDESLYIITGCIKSENWGLAAFREAPPFRDPAMHRFPRLVKLPGSVGVGSPDDPAYDWRSPGTFDSYVGKSEGGSQDQCLFLRGFKLDFAKSFRSQARRKQAALTERHELKGRGQFEYKQPKRDDRGGRTGSSGGGANGGGSSKGSRRANDTSMSGAISESEAFQDNVSITPFPSESHHQSCHPSDIINEFLLKKSGLDFALCHDDDWRYLLAGNPDSLDSEGRSSLLVSIEHGVAVLSLEQRGPGDPLADGQAAEDPLYMSTPVATDDTNPSPVPLSQSSENVKANPGISGQFLCDGATGMNDGELEPRKENIPALAEDSTVRTSGIGAMFAQAHLYILRQRSANRKAQPRKSQVDSCPSQYAVNPTETYALLIGINKYAKPDICNLRSACIDADNMDEFLRNTLGVPSQNIINLRDEQATRQGILDGFQELEKKSAGYYKPGDKGHDHGLGPCMVVFFCGHAAGAGNVEFLCPSDMHMPSLTNGVLGLVEGIADKTVCDLLDKLSKCRGNNIIFILDCSREGVHPLPAGTDGGGLPVTSQEPGFGSKLHESHVLLAACERGQRAYEQDGSGIFTTALLKVLKLEAKLQSFTYSSLMTTLDIPEIQKPCCEGRNIHRHLFTIQEADPSFIPCMMPESRSYPYTPILRAGTAQGIACEELFSIHEYDFPASDPNPNPSIGSLCVTAVRKASSALPLVRITDGASFRFQAMVSGSLFILSTLLSIAFQVNAVPSTWVPAAQRRQAGQVITQCTVPGTVAMTFDDGPYEYTKEIVDLLKSYDATATFFFNGNNYDCVYDYASSQRVKYVYKNGMHVASHTWSHGDLASMDSRHRVTPAFMRPPYGSYNSYVLDAAYMRGQAVVMWDFDSEDSMGATPEESIRSYEQKIGEHPSTMLLLNHETYGTTARQVLPAILPQLKEAGYRIVDVATCLGLPQYQEVTTPSPRDLWTKTAKASFVLPHFRSRTPMFKTYPRGNPKGSISDAEVNKRPVITVDGSMTLESPFSEHLKSNYIPSCQETPVIRQILREQDAIIRDLDVEYQDIEEAVSKLYERQRQILSKRALHREFRDRHFALLCPVRALPVDVLSEIFVRVVPRVWTKSTTRKNAAHPAVILSHVCRQWRELSLNLPSLWSTMPIDSLPPFNSGLPGYVREQEVKARFRTSMASSVDMASAFIHRAGAQPMTISFSAADRHIWKDNVEFSKPVNALVDVLLKARWEDVQLDLQFFGKTSPLARFFPLPPSQLQPRPQDQGAHDLPLLYSLDIDIPGQQMCDMRLDWNTLTELSMGPTWDVKYHRWHAQGRAPTLTTQQALAVLRKCPNLVRCALRLNPGPGLSDPLHTSATPDVFSLEHLQCLEIWGTPPPKALANCLLLPSLRRLSTMYDWRRPGPNGPESEFESALVEWIKTYGTHLVDVSFDYGSLTQSALQYCLTGLANVRSLTVVPSMFYQNEDGQESRYWHPESATLNVAILEKLTPKFDSTGSILEMCLCPKLESITAFMGPVEQHAAYECAGSWVELIAARRGANITSDSSTVSWLSQAEVTFREDARIEWGWRMDGLRERKISRNGLVLDRYPYRDESWFRFSDD
ncbi:hypothetical protein NMY22_g3910 [Coprinellus aureogranulatus]|nr:hypothetical protein NMY22_g3910 [Coprinellus aureogranulatus]